MSAPPKRKTDKAAATEQVRNGQEASDIMYAKQDTSPMPGSFPRQQYNKVNGEFVPSYGMAMHDARVFWWMLKGSIPTVIAIMTMLIWGGWFNAPAKHSDITELRTEIDVIKGDLFKWKIEVKENFAALGKTNVDVLQGLANVAADVRVLLRESDRDRLKEATAKPRRQK